MKLSTAQRDKLLLMIGYLDTILVKELRTTGKAKEEYKDDAMYNAILSAMGSIKEALEQNEYETNQRLSDLAQTGINSQCKNTQSKRKP
jgi:hypothetical protein